MEGRACPATNGPSLSHTPSSACDARRRAEKTGRGKHERHGRCQEARWLQQQPLPGQGQRRSRQHNKLGYAAPLPRCRRQHTALHAVPTLSAVLRVGRP